MMSWADDVVGAVTHFMQEMDPEDLSCVLNLLECSIEFDEVALQSDRSRKAAVDWILQSPHCAPESLLQSTRHTALQSYLLVLTMNNIVLDLSKSDCIKCILSLWGRPRSGEHARTRVSKHVLYAVLKALPLFEMLTYTPGEEVEVAMKIASDTVFPTRILHR